MILELIASACMIAISIFQVRLLFRQTSLLRRQTEINERLENLQRVLAEKTLGLSPSLLDQRLTRDQSQESSKPVRNEKIHFLE